jgi:23S rRNA pseudouridine1911/1915/1917 synthase
MHKLNIIFEDNHIIVVEKPVGILSQSDYSNEPDMLTLVKDYIREKYNKPGNVYVGLLHRLDRNVGGIMVFAKTSKAAARINKYILNHEFKKYYFAIINGKLPDKKGVLKHFLVKDEKESMSLVFDSLNEANHDKAREAILEYEVLDEAANKSLIRINLITGRFHQIRSQFAHIGHPLYGDNKYSPHSLVKTYKNNFPALFAYKVSFEHPVTHESLTFELEPKGEPWDSFLHSKNQGED